MQLIKRPTEEAGKAWPAILIGIFVAFGGVLFGYDTGTIGGILAMDYWQELFSTGYVNSAGQPIVSPSQASAIVSILSAGTFFGALGSPLMADQIGRRLALVASTFVFVLGVILQTAAIALPMFLAGRFFAGFGVGLISALIPLYQAETAPKWIRGAIIGSYQFAITVGLLLAAIVDNATHDRQDTSCYRIPIAVQFAWAIILVFGLLLLPETPRYLVRRGHHEAAARALGRLRRLSPGHPAVGEELNDITVSHEQEQALGKSSSVVDCFRSGMRKRQLTGMALQALQQLTGINFIFYYGTQYFTNSGVDNPFIVQMITSCINVVSTLPGLWAIERWGRRPLLLGGAVGMCVCQLIVAVLGTTTTSQDVLGNILVHNLAAQKASIAFVCVYIFFFASTWGPLGWVVTGEIFPLQHRARALAMTTATNWLLNWAIAYSTPYLVNYGPGYANLQSKIFFVWFGCCFICIAFVYFFIYETKGLSLEEIDQMYTEGVSARKSSQWTPPGPPGGPQGGVLAVVQGGAIDEESKDSKPVVRPSIHPVQPIVQHAPVQQVPVQETPVQEALAQQAPAHPDPAYLMPGRAQPPHAHSSATSTSSFHSSSSQHYTHQPAAYDNTANLALWVATGTL